MSKITEKQYKKAKEIVLAYEQQEQRDTLLRDPSLLQGTPLEIFERKIFHEIYIKLKDLEIVKEKEEVFEMMSTRITNFSQRKENQFVHGTFVLDQDTPILDYDYESLMLRLR